MNAIPEGNHDLKNDLKRQLQMPCCTMIFVTPNEEPANRKETLLIFDLSPVCVTLEVFNLLLKRTRTL